MAKGADKQLVLILLYPQRNAFCNTLKAEALYGFNSVTYEDLIVEFKKIRLNIFENLRAVVLMEDFIMHMEEYIMKESFNIEIPLDMWSFEDKNRGLLDNLKCALKKSKDQFDNYVENRMQALICEKYPQEEWCIRHASTYVQLYKKEWDKCQVHFELLKIDKDVFVPSELKVVLHTQEGRKVPRTKNLWRMGQGTEKNIKISYESKETFEKSMDEVFGHLKDLIDTYTNKIDKEMSDPNKVEFSSMI
jgi:hypothetical protein